jgi:hypothetical protein
MLVEERGAAAIRPLLGLLALAKEHGAHELNQACAEAVSYRAMRLRDVRRLLEQPDPQDHFAFMDEHPLIREMNVYGAFIKQHTTETP